MNTSTYLKMESLLLNQSNGQKNCNPFAVRFPLFKGILLFLLLALSFNAWAQTSQTPTQTVTAGNEPYLVTPTPGSGYTWTIIPGNSGTDWEINGNGNSISVDWNLPGVYTLSVVETNASGCNGVPVSVIVTVFQTPDVNHPPDQTICNGSLTNSVYFTGAVPGTVFNWTNDTPGIGLAASGSGNIESFSAVNTGTVPVIATITVTPSYTNEGITYTGISQSFTITVNPQPVTSPIFHN
ncbi:MAG: hypothetical protein IPN67_18005 [Bacteroidales bacterium]|nr:hypothetical protein [Bacteroidales bacterium]